MPIIQLKTFIEADIQLVFDLSRSVDLHQYSTQETNEKAIKGVTAGLMDKGDMVTWRAKHLGIYQTLTSKITAFESPHYFVDEMVRGAFKSFRHEHIFEQQEGGTLMIDVFDYEAPLALLGKLANVLFLKNYMQYFLEKRNSCIKSMAESGEGLAICTIPKVIT